MAIGDRKSVTMGKDIFYVQQFPVFEGMRVWGELQKLVIPAIGGAAVGAGQGEENGIIGGLMMLSENVDGEKAETLTRILLNPAYVSVKIGGEGQPIPLDEDTMNRVFTGRTFDVIILAWKVAQINFLDFRKLSGLPTGIANVLGNIKLTFPANWGANLSEKFSSTAQLTAE